MQVVINKLVKVSALTKALQNLGVCNGLKKSTTEGLTEGIAPQTLPYLNQA